MAKKYLDLIKIAYPYSNRAYVVAVNDKVLEEGGSQANPDVNIESGLEDQTVTILKAAGLFTAANRKVK